MSNIKVTNFAPDTDVIIVDVTDKGGQRSRVCVSRLEDGEVEILVLKLGTQPGPPTSRDVYLLGKN